MRTNLIVCVTPLQMLIAEHIIKKTENEDRFVTIVISYDNNKKYNYYINKLSKVSESLLHYYVKTDSKINRVYELLKFRFLFKKLNISSYDKVFVSAIENPFILFILSQSKFRLLRTFDDGTANINQNSIYYRDLKIGKAEKVIRKIVGINWTRDEVKKQSELHYTLYPNYSNIVEPVEVLDFFSEKVEIKNEIISHEIIKEYNIFLGQPLFRLDSMIDDEFVNDVVKKLKIDKYFPHPRERSIVEGVEYLDSQLVFEDFLIDFINNSPNVIINIYTFFSTAALNVANFKNVNIYCVYNAHLRNRYKFSYLLFDKLQGIKYVEV